jgi:hypothetical protein
VDRLKGSLPTCPPGSTTISDSDCWVPHETTRGRKYELIAAVAADLAPKLSIDRDELETQGYSPASHSRQFAALIEVLVCELYSTLDGLRFTTYHLYREVRGVQVKSTSRLFTKAAEGTYGTGFPSELNELLAAVARSEWFPNLRRLRTAFTHGGLGPCHLSQDRTRISYSNASLGDGGTSHVIPDIVAHLNGLAEPIFKLLRDYFGYHYPESVTSSTAG